MHNIWEFLLLTTTLSLAALILLILKKLLSDKLSPRWQYSIWILLILRLIIPIPVYNRYVLLPLPQWIETLKFTLEQNFTSAYSKTFEPLSAPFGIPIVQKLPSSPTDIIFLIYAVGVAAVLIYYITSYLRLCRLVKIGSAVSAANESNLKEAAALCGCSVSKAVELENVPSAFVFGIFKPVLVLPTGIITDHKVLLHELMHLKYHDSLQSVLWSLIRALNWCNPFMHYVISKILSDMEALCDQRVLEILDGEDRREYGKILLSMVNEKYPSAFGTTSISNGGKEIAARIKCIVHFKKYPRGMKLVSICIGFILLQPLFAGIANSNVFAFASENNVSTTLSKLNSAFAAIRVNRCTTVAGAIDTYAKGICYENGIYLAAASPLADHQKYYEHAKAIITSANSSEKADYYDTGLRGNLSSDPMINISMRSSVPYNICNIQESDDAFTCDLVILLDNVDGTENQGFTLHKIKIYNENDYWVVEPISEPKTTLIPVDDVYKQTTVFHNLKPLAEYELAGEHGKTELIYNVFYALDPKATTITTQDDMSWFMGPTVSVNQIPVMNVQFQYAQLSSSIKYTLTDSTIKPEKVGYCTIEHMAFAEVKDIPDNLTDMDEDGHIPRRVSGGSSSSTGYGYTGEVFDIDEWNGKMDIFNIGKEYYYEPEFKDIFTGGDDFHPIALPKATVVNTYLDGRVEHFVLKDSERRQS